MAVKTYICPHCKGVCRTTDIAGWIEGKLQQVVRYTCYNESCPVYNVPRPESEVIVEVKEYAENPV